ncbi:MAG: hypothetical protein Q9219_000926 [cf. Caloplaca sp. 3 TL-2023]
MDYDQLLSQLGGIPTDSGTDTEHLPVSDKEAHNEASDTEAPSHESGLGTTKPAEDFSNFINGKALPSRPRGKKRKAAELADKGTQNPQPKADKRRKPHTPGHGSSVTHATVESQPQVGKLSRVRPKRYGQVNNAVIRGGDLFEVPDETQTEGRTPEAPVQKSTRAQESSATATAVMVPPVVKDQDVVASSPKKARKRKAETKGPEPRQEYLNEEPHRVLRDRKAVHTPSKVTARQKSGRPAKQTRSVISAMVPELTETTQVGEDVQSLMQQEGVAKADYSLATQEEVGEDDQAYVHQEEVGADDQLNMQQEQDEEDRHSVTNGDQASDCRFSKEGGFPADEPVGAKNSGPPGGRNPNATQQENSKATVSPKIRTDGRPLTEERGEQQWRRLSPEAESSGESDGSDGSDEPDNRNVQSPEIPSDAAPYALFGKQMTWSKILVAKQKIVDLRAEGGESLSVTRTKNRILVNKIKKAISLYDAIAGTIDLDSAATPDISVNQQQELLDHIHESIKNQEEEFPLGEKKARKFIRDVYAYIIPEIISPLEKAIKTRSAQLSTRENITALREIIKIQDMLTMLCQRARGWKAKPQTSYPIIKPTVTIKPLIEQLREAFVEELHEREDRIARRRKDARQAKETEQRECERQKQAEIWRRERAMRQRQAWDEIRRKVAGMPGFPTPLSQTNSRRQGSEFNRPKALIESQWARDQDEELLAALWAEDLGDLPGRFLARLPLLPHVLSGVFS